MSTLSATSALSGTTIAAGNGAVYVPSALVDTYKSNANWSNYFIASIDDYPLTDFSTITDSWETIIAKAQAGTAAQSYSVKDTKLLDLGTEGKVYAQVAKVGSNGITFVTKGMLKTSKRMNPANSSGTQGTGANGGWEHSEMRAYLSDTILPLFPSELQSAIKTETKYSGNIVPGESSVTKDGCVTADKLWLLSDQEVTGSTTYETQGEHYSSLFPDQSSRVKYNQSGFADYWWLRSANSATSFRSVYNAGGAYSSNADFAYGVVLGFSI